MEKKNNNKILKIAIAVIVVVLMVMAVILLIKPGNNSNSSESDKSNATVINQNNGGSGVESTDNSKKDKNMKVSDPVIIPVDPGKTNIDPSREIKKGKSLDYATYVSMSAEDQYEFYKTFKSSDDFLDWYNNAKQEYDKNHKSETINPGDVIDLGGN